MGRSERAGLQVDDSLARFLDDEALPAAGLAPEDVWPALSALLHDLAPRNRALLETRARLQAQIDTRLAERRGQAPDPGAEAAFLREIGWLLPEPAPFTIETPRTDPEIAQLAGPQLVVPVTNPRYALNAANARWGSLYDALYGTDAIAPPTGAAGYDPERGAQVVAWVRGFLDRTVPLATGRWAEVARLHVAGGSLHPALADPSAFAGFVGEPHEPTEIWLRHHGLAIRIVIDPGSEIGRTDPAGIADVILESALSAIMDCEDSVSCVDGPDKVQAYRTWLGLMQGDQTETVEKGGRRFVRRLAEDLDHVGPDGRPLRAKGRALMLVRNVGHLMTTPAVLDRDGAEVFEGLLDAFVTVLCAIPDLGKPRGAPRNSVTGSVYVVKPKMHGPDEVAFACKTFDRVEDALGLPWNTVKIGIMDEERRTSANLAACIHAARQRLCFINTGFLDRTGDEIFTGMEAGPMVPKGAMKAQPWIAAYEDRNVDIGLACGLPGKAQIGKGMWAMPDRMADLLAQKGAHPKAGASTAWVPSPTAATLHAVHYHEVDVAARQVEIAAEGRPSRLEDLLTIPLMSGQNLSEGKVAAEVENSCQSILGYVVRWIDQGIGCSKVPDIHDVGMMEDRATLRISAQALGNWLHHGVVTEEQLRDALRRMAVRVDAQNAGDPAYRPMAPGFDGVAFRAASELVFEARRQPSGYTEPILHARRREAKARA